MGLAGAGGRARGHSGHCQPLIQAGNTRYA